MTQLGPFDRTDSLFQEKTVTLAGLGDMALPLAGLLAEAGLGAFVLLNSSQADPGLEDRLIREIQSRGRGASIRLVQVSSLDSRDHLLARETDLLLDCSKEPSDHIALEEACRAQGIPLVLAFASPSLCLTGLVDPYAGSLALLFQEEPLRPDSSMAARRISEIELVQETCHLILSALAGQASFFRTPLNIYDRLTSLSESRLMPSGLPSYPRMVMVGSDWRDLGKTTLCSRLTRKLVGRGQKVRVLKIENQGAEGAVCLVREKRQEEKPAIRALFEAGAEGVWRLMVSEKKLGQALGPVMEEIYETMGERTILLCETNTGRRFMQAGVFVHLRSAEGHVKPSAVRTRRLADLSPLAPFTDDHLARIMEKIAE